MAEKISVELELKNSQYLQKLNQSQEATQKFASLMKGAFAFGALVSGFKKLVTVTETQQKAESQLNAVLKSTQYAAGLTAKEIKNMASALQEQTTFGDEAIIQGQNMLLTFTKIGKEVFPQATETVLNMAAAMGTDLKTQAIQVGKALQDPILGVTALRRVGVQLSAQQTQQIKDFVKLGDVAGAQKVILGELETQFGGVARSASETLGGSLTQLSNKLGDLAERLGNDLTPDIKVLTGALDRLITPVKGTEKSFSLLNTTMSAVIKTATLLINIVTVSAAGYEKLSLRMDIHNAQKKAEEALNKKNGAEYKRQIDIIARLSDEYEALQTRVDVAVHQIKNGATGTMVSIDGIAKNLLKNTAIATTSNTKLTESVKKQGKTLKTVTQTDINAYINGLGVAGSAIDLIVLKVTTDTDKMIQAQNKFLESHKMTAIQALTVMEETGRAIQQRVVDGQQQMADLYIARGMGLLQFTANSVNQISQLYNMQTSNALKNINIKRDAEIKAVSESTASEESKQIQIDALNEKYAKKQAKLEHKAAVMRKKLAIAETILTIPQAAFNSYTWAAKLGGPIAGGIAATIATGIGLRKLQLISETPIPAAAMGAYLPGSSSGQLIRAGEGGRSEAILPLENERIMSKISDAIGGSRDVTVNIDGQKLFMINENRRNKVSSAFGGKNYYTESVY